MTALKQFCTTPVTYALIGINVIIFILIKTRKLSIYKLGMLNSKVEQDKEYYRIVSSAFTHEEPLHILCNMYSLYNIGCGLEISLGMKYYIILYLIVLLLGGSISCLIHRKFQPYALCIGASGTICGLLGIYIAIVFTIYGIAGIKSIIPSIILLLLMTASKKIDSIGHFSGLIVGIICGFAFIALLRL